MANATSLGAPRGAAGTCRRRRRLQRAARPEWVRAYRRVQQDLDASFGLIDWSYCAAEVSEKCAASRPVGTAQKLSSATRRLAAGTRRLLHAARELANAQECLERMPGCRDQGPELIALAAERWGKIAAFLEGTAAGVVALQLDVLAGLATGELVPEPATGRRPRIIVAPRPVSIRAFLTARRPRVADRIASILSRRRRTPRPASVRVPRRHLRGRAPPLGSICLL